MYLIMELFAPTAWSSGNVFAHGDMGREIESRSTYTYAYIYGIHMVALKI
jgi:hypothetical protein